MVDADLTHKVIRSSADKTRVMRTLIVEDDFMSRLVLQTLFARYGECHMAVNGREAVEAFRSAHENKKPYELICMDIMMPEMDGHAALKQIRDQEESAGILFSDRVKVIMTTALDDVRTVMDSFKGMCDAYLIKPIDVAKLLEHVRSFQLDLTPTR